MVNLFRHDEFHPAAQVIRETIAKKCAYKNVPFPTIGRLSLLHEELVAYWPVMLALQLPSLPPVEAFWSEPPALFAWIEEGRRGLAPTAFPLARGDIVIRP